jgi:hypothetical protein
VTPAAPLDRGRLAARQAGEYLLAALLVGAALHAPHRGELLFAAAVIIAGWAALHRAPLGPAGLVGIVVHRVGLGALALATAALGIRYLTDVAISGPLGLATIVLGQLAIGGRRSTVTPVTATTAALATDAPMPDAPMPDAPMPDAPMPDAVTAPPTTTATTTTATTPTDAPTAAPAGSGSGGPSVDARKIGYIAGQMGSLIGREAQRAVPAAAHRAGRGAGRLLRRRSPPTPAPAERLDDRPQ